MKRSPTIVWRRLIALCRKESFQIVRDPSSIIIAFLLPIGLLLIFGFGVDLDAMTVRVGVLNGDSGPEAARFVAALAGSPYLEIHPAASRPTLDHWLLAGDIRGMVIVQSDFGARLARPAATAPIEVITDGAEPNTASFVASYVQGVWEIWSRERALDRGIDLAPPLDLTLRDGTAVRARRLLPGDPDH